MQDYTTKIYEILKELCKYSDGMSVDEDILKKRIVTRGYTEEEMAETLQKYLDLNLIMKDRKMVTLVE